MIRSHFSLPMRRASSVALLASAVSLFPVLAYAQQSNDETVVEGRILDATTSEPVVGAFVRSLTREGGVRTDERGGFRLTVRTEPLHYVAVTHLGYGEAEVAVTAEDAAVPVDIMIAPDPIAMEELRVFHDRYEARRNRYAGSVRSIQAEDLYASGADTAYDLIMRRGYIVPCGVSSCAYSRGRKVPVEVWIDERPLWGDLDWLDAYAVEDLYLVEIFDRGRMVRLYTRGEVERNPQRLSALAVAPMSRTTSFTGGLGWSSWDSWPNNRAPRSLR